MRRHLKNTLWRHEKVWRKMIENQVSTEVCLWSHLWDYCRFCQRKLFWHKTLLNLKVMKNKNQCNKKTVFVNKVLDLKEVVSPKKIIFWEKKRNIHILVIFYFIDKGLGRFSDFVTNCKESCSTYWKFYKAYTKSISI